MTDFSDIEDDFFTGKLFYLGSISIRMQHDDMPFVRQPINRKAGTRPVSRLLVPAFLKAYYCVEWPQRCAWRALLATIPRSLSFNS